MVRRHTVVCHEQIKDHECEFCEERFLNKSLLIYHLLAEHYQQCGVDPMECKDCKKIFHRPHTWISHMKTVHKTEPPMLECPRQLYNRKCRNRFPHQSVLTLHIQQVHDNKRMVIIQCLLHSAVLYYLLLLMTLIIDLLISSCTVTNVRNRMRL